MSKSYLQKMFKDQQLTEAEQRRWVLAHGDKQLYDSLLSDERPPTEEPYDNPQGLSSFYMKNKIKYIDNTDSSDEDRDIAIFAKHIRDLDAKNKLVEYIQE